MNNEKTIDTNNPAAAKRGTKKRQKRKKNIDSTGMTVAYYILQYLAVRTALWGFTSQPTIVQLYNSFNISGIALSVRYVLDYFTMIYRVEYLLLMVIIAIPFIFAILWEFRFIALYIFVLAQLIAAVISYIRYQKYKKGIDLSKHVITKSGAPGAGKSSSALWLAVETAKRKWRDLKFKYHIMRYKLNKMKRKKQTPSKEFLKAWKEVDEAFNFFNSNEGVKCLYTNIPLMVNGRFTNVLTADHARMTKRLAAFSVLFFDEIGAEFSVDAVKGGNRPLTVSDFFRLCRHFGDFIIISTEQDAKNIFIDARRVSAANIEMKEQKWVLKPLLFCLPFEFIKRLFLIKPEAFKFLIPLLLLLSNTLRYIGFRRYKEYQMSGTESAHKEKHNRKTYCLPTMLNCTYDERTFRELYAAKDKELEVNIFKSLILPESLNLLRSRVTAEPKPKKAA